MTPSVRTSSGWTWRLGVTVWLLALVVPVWPPAAAQPATEEATVAGREVYVAASEDRLWLARVEDGRCLLSTRGPSDVWVSGQPFNAPIVALAAAGRDAYAFSEDGSFRRYHEEWSPADNLPDRQLAIHMVGIDGELYALVRSSVAAKLPLLDFVGDAPTSQPFEPGEAPLSIVRYDSRGWSAIAACPQVVAGDAPAELRPRLCHAHGQLMLFWLARPRPAQIGYARFDIGTHTWRSGGAVGVPGLTAFAVPVVNRVPTLVASVRADGAEELVAYRLLEGVESEAEPSWQRAEFALSPLPADAGAVRYAEAFGFNQHLGVLVTGEDGSAYLRFGRFDGPSAMETDDVFDETRARPAGSTFQTARAVILLGILAALLVFRRGSIVTPIVLPPGWGIAMTLQRLAGCLLDLAIFSLVAAVLMQLNWLAALREMGRWAWAAEPATGSSGLPESRMLWWWCVSAGGYTVYSLVMELLRRRTVGKLLTRVSLMSESAVPPTAWQIVVRNLFRFVEVMPPFWILGFLVVLSRNRQRVGDVFARTLAVRRVTAPPGEKDATDEE